MANNNSELADAFPTMLREDALVALSGFPEPIKSQTRFFVNVAGEVVSIPGRVYYGSTLIHTQRLSGLQRELIDCLLTRHHNGYVRQSHLERIINSPNIWIPPFVVQLVGEYVIEILQVIDNNLSSFNTPAYAEFISSNPEFIALTERRVMSYWNEYYRHPPWDGHRTVYARDEYVGFRLMQFFKSLAQNGHTTGP
jgi:hypothetical protein